MPNFFGPQRFGSKKNNHEIGKLIVDKKFAEALNMINASGGRYASLKHVEKRKLKFYINAYQSEIFNKKLEITTKTGKIKIPGFNVDELMLSCSGFEREAYVVPKNMACEKYGVKFELNRINTIMKAYLAHRKMRSGLRHGFTGMERILERAKTWKSSLESK